MMSEREETLDQTDEKETKSPRWGRGQQNSRILELRLKTKKHWKIYKIEIKYLRRHAHLCKVAATLT